MEELGPISGLIHGDDGEVVHESRPVRDCQADSPATIDHKSPCSAFLTRATRTATERPGL